MVPSALGSGKWENNFKKAIHLLPHLTPLVALKVKVVGGGPAAAGDQDALRPAVHVPDVAARKVVDGLQIVCDSN